MKTEWLGQIGWDAPMLCLLIGVGAWLAVRLRGFPLLRPRAAFQVLRQKDRQTGGVTPTEALFTALAGTIGAGNIVGVAGAITLGGPGAVLWMWVTALLGIATKYSEIVLTLETRVRGSDGAWRGGPWIALMRRGKAGKALGTAFLLCAVLASFGIGNAVQMQTIVSSVAALPGPVFAARGTHLLIGAATAAAVLLLGRGAKRVGRVASRLVPWMGALYVAAAGAVLVRYAPWIPRVAMQILRAAFDPRAVLGGGIGVWQAVRAGAARGVFSNEAGLGSAPLAHASAETGSSVRQGLIGSLEVLCVTVVCTLTALVILLPAAAGAAGYAIPYGETGGAPLVMAALGCVFGEPAAAAILGMVLVCFALSSILTWNLYGSRCAKELFGARGTVVHRVLFGAVLITATQPDAAFVWSVSELFNALMATPNLLSLLLLFPIVARATRSFCRKPHGTVETDARM